ncbi:MAG: alanine:cation symporter family protein [Candidatus Omnitrophica bacterium]|nr:alanine:cation symporter family protein [Candidatus Omnitrophota bacterium]
MSSQYAPNGAKHRSVRYLSMKMILGCGILLIILISAITGMTATAQQTSPEPEKSAVSKVLDPALEKINGVLGTVLMYNVSGDTFQKSVYDEDGEPVVDPDTGELKKETIAVPLIVVTLAVGAVFFSFWYRWITIRGFKHSIDIIRGHYDDEKDEGEISHFRALTSALSATVGLGNIAGVAIAIQQGGPGAVFWMMTMAVFGMASKFSSCTLSQLYRQYNPDGTISGGPMYYLDLGFRAKGSFWAPIGKFLAVMYAFMVMGGSVGGGNMFQANQAFKAFSDTFNYPEKYDWAFGLVLTFLVGVVIIGGIRRIGAATSRIVPSMCGLYIVASLVVIGVNYEKIPESLFLIFEMAFTQNALFGGMVGVIVTGVTRAAFSNEAGLGSAAIAHAAAKTDEPVREGLVAMIEPFIDTIIVCLMTSLVVIVSGVWDKKELADGVIMTSAAFDTVLPWFRYILTICIFLFAYSTMISWCYYGERGWIYLLDHFGHGAGLRSVVVFRLVFVFFVFWGTVNELTTVLTFSDMMILSMAFPNIIGSILLAPTVLKIVQDYWRRFKSGEMLPDR